MQPQLAHIDLGQANLLHQDLPRVGTARLAIGAAGAATACIGALVVASIVWFVYAIISLDEERRRHNLRASIIQQIDDINLNLAKSKAAQWHRNKRARRLSEGGGEGWNYPVAGNKLSSIS